MKMSFELHSRGLCSKTISSLTELSVYKKKQKNITFNETIFETEHIQINILSKINCT